MTSSSDRERALPLTRDSHAFLGAVGLGFIAMFGLKLLHAPQLLTTAIVAGIVVAYAVFVYRVPALKLRLDQAGDNAYYLGLIFTLLSMAWALWAVGQQVAVSPIGSVVSVAETVIGDFGLALGSTLAGIICRIVLHQMRTDPVGVEAASRLSLSVAAERTRMELVDISSQLARFFEELRQRSDDSTRELQEGYERTLAEVSSRVQTATGESIASLQAASDQMRASITEFSEASKDAATAFQEASQRLASVEPPPTKLSQGYNSMAEKVADVTEQLGLAVSALAGAAALMESAAVSIGKTSDSVAGVFPAIDAKIGKMERSIVQSNARIESSLNSTGDGIKRLSEAVEVLREGAGQTASLVADSERSAALVLSGLERAVQRIANSEQGKTPQ